MLTAREDPLPLNLKSISVQPRQNDHTTAGLRVTRRDSIGGSAAWPLARFDPLAWASRGIIGCGSYTFQLSNRCSSDMERHSRAGGGIVDLGTSRTVQPHDGYNDYRIHHMHSPSRPQ